MKGLEAFVLPLSGLLDGTHNFFFKVDDGFFRHFEKSLITAGIFEVNLEFDKRPNLGILLFDFQGKVTVNCDRCLELIQIPVSGRNELLIKFGGVAGEEDEIIYLHWKTESLNVAKFIYEFITLAMPLVKKYDCELDSRAPCNEEVLKYLRLPDIDGDRDSVWRDLKKLNFK